MNLFAACEKVIIGHDNNTSLISVLEHFTLSGEIAGKLPANAGLPFKWQVLVLWKRENELVEPVTYDVKIELIAPNDDAALGGDVQFVVSNQHFNFRNVFEFPIFPVGQQGIHKLNLNYKESDSENWEQVVNIQLGLFMRLRRWDDESNGGGDTLLFWKQRSREARS